jgi:hypothetical protein
MRPFNGIYFSIAIFANASATAGDSSVFKIKPLQIMETELAKQFSKELF